MRAQPLNRKAEQALNADPGTARPPRRDLAQRSPGSRRTSVLPGGVSQAAQSPGSPAARGPRAGTGSCALAGPTGQGCPSRGGLICGPARRPRGLTALSATTTYGRASAELLAALALPFKPTRQTPPHLVFHRDSGGV